MRGTNKKIKQERVLEKMRVNHSLQPSIGDAYQDFSKGAARRGSAAGRSD